MMNRVLFLATTLAALAACSTGHPVPVPAPLTQLNIRGETFMIVSAVLGEERRINVYAPPAYDEAADARRPVLYMPDGGVDEDFVHIAGLLQISVLNGTMRPFLLVGIENTERRRDLTGPTANAEDRKIAPRVGGSEAFRRFVRAELIPAIDARYRTTAERAIVGESLAGLFVVETLLREPDLFDTYIAFDPSLWWNDSSLVRNPGARVRDNTRPKTLYLANSDQPEMARLTDQIATRLRAEGGIAVHHSPMPEETHATIYHPAALRAFRMLFKPQE